MTTGGLIGVGRHLTLRRALQIVDRTLLYLDQFEELTNAQKFRGDKLAVLAA